MLDDGKIIVADPEHLPTLEGPKLYKRGGYYYIFAPFGGVGGGVQAVLRARNIYGPFEHRVVLAQGTTNQRTAPGVAMWKHRMGGLVRSFPVAWRTRTHCSPRAGEVGRRLAHHWQGPGRRTGW